MAEETTDTKYWNTKPSHPNSLPQDSRAACLKIHSSEIHSEAENLQVQ